MKEEIIEEVIEKKKIKWSKVILGTFFVIFALIGIFFLATYVRWKSEIANKHEIVYVGQEEVKIDKLLDFYGIELSTDLKEDEAILVYCTSEYGKECVTADYNNWLENNFRNPLLVIVIILVIDLCIGYILIKESITGKKRTYVYGGIILFIGLLYLGVQIFNIADYYKLVKTGKQIEGKETYYLKTNNKKEYTPVIIYQVENPLKKGNEEDEEIPEMIDVQYIPKDFSIKGDFAKRNVLLYQETREPDVLTPVRNYKKYILPVLTSIFVIVEGFIYLTINKRNKKKEEKEAKENKDKK